MKALKLLTLLLVSTACLAQIPLPEHPRPDFERSTWQNLNGSWDFEFDKNNQGLSENWASSTKAFTKKITVPFSWAAPLSGISSDEADIAWYKRTINVPVSWADKRTFITIGASDYETSVFLDGQKLGSHTGGYLPFSFELTKHLKYGQNQTVSIRVDDKRRDYALYGKQGYGDARGIWQTVYLEARGQNFIEALRLTPNIDNNTVAVQVEAAYANNLSVGMPVKIKIMSPNGPILSESSLKVGESMASFVVKIPKARLWTLEDPYLYQVELQLGNDKVKSYFGMRKVSVVNLPGTDYPYIAINNKPVYMQLTLDQSYHPTGFYTFPSDAFMRNEIKLAKDIGLNGIRTHIKIDVPRKLYWADKLGLLVMSDLPNFWGEPNAQARAESEAAMPEMIKRDYNHPAIFSWILFNETWGLKSKVEENGKNVSKYLPETQAWVAGMYQKAKALDASRLIEDNSICCGAGHTQTDINSWHEYLPGYDWEDHLATIDKNTYTGSSYHYEPGYTQAANTPNINSECGNVWGYTGSTGDVDWSWDYHRMMNTFRKYPKIAGWLYTEHHDVINEWNGYWRFDRSKKYSGMSDLNAGMSDRDFHSEVYISTGNEISKTVAAGEKVSIPLYLSSFTDKISQKSLVLEVNQNGTDALGQTRNWGKSSRTIEYEHFTQKKLEDLEIVAPNEKALVNIALTLKTKAGQVLHRNVFHVIVVQNATVAQNSLGQKVTLLSVSPEKYSNAQWSKKTWVVLDSMKACGAGAGFFEYSFNLNQSKGKKIQFLAELGAKPLYAKDIEKADLGNQDYMLGAKVDPVRNPNAYPMTDQTKTPTQVNIYANGQLIKTLTLSDDPADHRGVLSWHNQPKDRTLHDAGSYGFKTLVDLPAALLKTGKVVIKLEVDAKSAGGLAVYGENFGRYRFNPSILVYE